MRELNVDLGERSYPIYIGEGLLDHIDDIFTKHHITKNSPIMIITDERVAPYYLDKVSALLAKVVIMLLIRS